MSDTEILTNKQTIDEAKIADVNYIYLNIPRNFIKEIKY